LFFSEGSYVLAIEEIEHERKNIKIPIQVTPEFPVGLLASIIAMRLLKNRVKNNSCGAARNLSKTGSRILGRFEIIAILYMFFSLLRK
jgi:hypothetical protein